MFDISITGDKALQRKLDRLAGPAQRRVMRGATKKTATATKKFLLRNISGGKIHVYTGRLLRAFKAQRARGEKPIKNKKDIVAAIPLPTRAELGIAPDDKYYYPTAVEFGHKRAPAHPYMRPAVDEHYSELIGGLAENIAVGIVREAAKA